MMQARICEIFYSLQLEGAMLGYPAVFVRFSGCNLNCVFCDTKYAFDEYKIMSLQEVEKIVCIYGCKRIIFTGGEPLLYANFIKSFIFEYNKKYSYFLETNGTIWVDFAPLFEHIVVSPKFDHLNYEVLKKYRALKNVEFKVLVDNAQSLRDIEMFFKSLQITSATLQPIFLPDESMNDFIKRTQDIIEVFKRSNLVNSNVRLIIQNHKIIYEKTRGV
jgi:7-carboxy-7-deazaguanine synthase